MPLSYEKEDPRVVRAREQLHKADAEVAAEREKRWNDEREATAKQDREAKQKKTREEYRRRARRLIAEAISEGPDSDGVNPFAEFVSAVREVLKGAGKEVPSEVVTAIAIGARMMDVVADKYAEGYRHESDR